MTRKWETSGSNEHSKDSHRQINWLHSKILAKLPNINEDKIRKYLKINNLETNAECDKSIKALNRDRGNTANRNLWKPLFYIFYTVRQANFVK